MGPGSLDWTRDDPNTAATQTRNHVIERRRRDETQIQGTRCRRLRLNSGGYAGLMNIDFLPPKAQRAAVIAITL
jgi:hypothetical protein